MPIDPKKSRGYRNKNPGNIDHNAANKWQGLASPPLEEPPLNGGRARFARFISHEYGIRALALLLITYQDRYGLRTIQQIINRWAPGTENNTTSYVRFVDERMPRHSATDQLDLHAYADLRELVTAIIHHELGGQPYDAQTIDEGLKLAGVPKPVTTVRQAASTQTGRAAIQVGTITAAAGALAPAIEALDGIPTYVGIALVAAAAAVAITYVLMKRRDKENGHA